MPNILITGTPGTGKSLLSKSVADACGMNCINVGKVILEKELHDGPHPDFDTFILNEDKVLSCFSFWFLDFINLCVGFIG